MPGTATDWRHGWQPLSFTAAKAKFHQKIPPYWHAPLQDRPDRRSGKMVHGDWHEGHQAVSPAPIGVLGTERARYVSVKGQRHKHLVRGSWSDPWWMTQPGGGWAVSQRWQHKAQTGYEWRGTKGSRTFSIPAADERVLTPVDATGNPLHGGETTAVGKHTLPVLSAAVADAETKAKLTGAPQYVTQGYGGGQWTVSGERPRVFGGDHYVVTPDGKWARDSTSYRGGRTPLKGAPVHNLTGPRAGEVARAGTFDEAKHPRGYHGRWAHEGAGKGLPFSRSGGTVSYHGSLGIDRKDMPQLSGLVNGQYVPTAHMLPKFLDYLRSRGIAAQETTIPAAKLHPTQTTGDTPAIRKIADALKSGEYEGKRITVSQDNRVLDGHHNWAGLLLANSEGHKGDQKVLQVGLPARELLAEMRAFAKREGIASRQTGEHANPQYAARMEAAELVAALAAGPGLARSAALAAAASLDGGTAGDWDRGQGQAVTGRPAVAQGLTWEPGESAALAVLAVLVRAFNPGEARDFRGKWTRRPGGGNFLFSGPPGGQEHARAMEALARDLDHEPGQSETAQTLRLAIHAMMRRDLAAARRHIDGAIYNDQVQSGGAHRPELEQIKASLAKVPKGSVKEPRRPLGKALDPALSAQLQHLLGAGRPGYHPSGLLTPGVVGEYAGRAYNPRELRGVHGRWARSGAGAAAGPAGPSPLELAAMVSDLSAQLERARADLGRDQQAIVDRVRAEMRAEQAAFRRIHATAGETAEGAQHRKDQMVKSVVNVLALAAVALLTIATAGLALPPLVIAGISVGPLIGAEAAHVIHTRATTRPSKLPVSPGVMRAAGGSPRDAAAAALVPLVAGLLGLGEEQARQVAGELVDLAQSGGGQVARFDPRELRDPHGKWTRGGGALGKAAKAATGGLAASAGIRAESSGNDSVAKHMRPDGTWDPARQKLHDQIVSDALAGHHSQASPVATFLGGGTASGKSTALASAAHKDQVVIDSDAIKGLLPDYQQKVKAGDPSAAAYAHEESSYLAKRIQAAAIARKLNYLLDGTGDASYAKMAAKIKAARDGGHRVDAKYVTAATEEAVRRAEARAKETGRMVPESVIRSIHAGVSEVFPKLVESGLLDSAELWDTNGAKPLLVGSMPHGGKWTVKDQAAWDAFKAKAAT